jgi:uncharacterized protein (UPF0332 family)
MGLSNSLLLDAAHLIQRGATKPSQSSLRRAVSTAYYALFHCISEKGVNFLFGPSSPYSFVRKLSARSFTHQRLFDVCMQFQFDYAKMKPTYREAFHLINPTEIKLYCGAVIDLQQNRHIADYDLSAVFNKNDTLTLLRQAEIGVKSFQNALVNYPEEVNTFLGLILFERGLR